MKARTIDTLIRLARRAAYARAALRLVAECDVVVERIDALDDAITHALGVHDKAIAEDEAAVARREEIRDWEESRGVDR